MQGGDPKQTDPRELLANLATLSNAQVDALLLELLSEVDETQYQGLILETSQPTSVGNHADITNPQTTAEKLLGDLDQLSDQTVDALIKQLLAEENRDLC